MARAGVNGLTIICLAILWTIASEPIAASDDAAPRCDLSPSPKVLLKPGQRTKLTFVVKNAVSAELEDDKGSVPLSGERGYVWDAPSVTKTYTMRVTGRTGTATCRTSVAVPERTQPLSWPPTSFVGFPEDYLERARMSLAVGITSADLTTEQLWVFYATSALLFEQDKAAVNAYFSKQWQMPVHKKWGFGLFSMDSIRLYGLFSDRSRYFPDRLTPSAQRHVEDQFYKVVSQRKFNDYSYSSDLENVWTLPGTASENLTLASSSSNFLASQFLKNSPDFATRAYDDGRAPADHYHAWRRFFSQWFDERAKRGAYVEVGSPSYEDESRQAIQNIRDFAEDPVIQQKAEMFLDLTYALIVEDSIKGVRGGARSRVYSFKRSFWGAADDRSYNLIFGSGDAPYVAKQAIVQSTSTYYPPPAILKIAIDAGGKGRFESIERRPGVGVSSPTGTRLDPDRSVYRYGFMTPSYVLGSFVLDPSAFYVAPSGQNRWQGLIFDGDPEARIAPQVTRLKGAAIDSEQRVRNGFASVQDRNILITQRSNYQTGYSAATSIYFSDTLDYLEEEDNWIFVREGSAFAAIRIVVADKRGYEWIDPQAKNRHSDKKKNFINLSDANAPIIMIANQASDFDGDFERFKAAIRGQAISYDGQGLTFSTLTYKGPSQVGKRGGTTVDIQPSRVYDSPFIRSEWGSGIIFIRKGSDTVRLDFSQRSKPIKINGDPVTSVFPSGVGEAKPVIFSTK